MPGGPLLGPEGMRGAGRPAVEPGCLVRETVGPGGRYGPMGSEPYRPGIRPCGRRALGGDGDAGAAGDAVDGHREGDGARPQGGERAAWAGSRSATGRPSARVRPPHGVRDAEVRGAGPVGAEGEGDRHGARTLGDPGGHLGPAARREEGGGVEREAVHVRPGLYGDPVGAARPGPQPGRRPLGRRDPVRADQAPAGEPARVGRAGGCLARIAVDEVRDPVDAGGVEDADVAADEGGSLAGRPAERGEPLLDEGRLLAVAELTGPLHGGVARRHVLDQHDGADGGVGGRRVQLLAERPDLRVAAAPQAQAGGVECEEAGGRVVERALGRAEPGDEVPDRAPHDLVVARHVDPGKFVAELLVEHLAGEGEVGG